MFAVTAVVSDDYVVDDVNSDAGYFLVLWNRMILTSGGELITLNAFVILLNTCIQVRERALVMSTHCFAFSII